MIKKLYDKSTWKNGPWRDENDFAAFIDDDTLFPITMRRNEFGAWCAFVGIDDTHPLFLSPLENLPTFDVHYGVGFVGFMISLDAEFCPPIRRWWIGFNCSTDSDYCPRKKTQTKRGITIKQYRTEEYVYDQAQQLAQYLAQQRQS